MNDKACRWWTRFLLRHQCSTGRDFFDELLVRANAVRKARTTKGFPANAVALLEADVAETLAEFIHAARRFDGTHPKADA